MHRYLDTYGIGAGQHVVLPYDEEEDCFIVNDHERRRDDIDLYDEDADNDEHDRHNDNADIISGRKTTKYFFQKWVW